MSTSRTCLASLSLLVALATLTPGASGAAEQIRLSGQTVQLWNVAGEITLEPGSGPDVIVSVERGGRDGGRLKLATDRTLAGSRLRVLYPADRIVYAQPGRGRSQTQSRLRADGTWGGDVGWGGRRVSVVSRGSGLEAHADLRIQVPSGKRVEVHLLAGEGQQRSVSADVFFDGAATPFRSEGSRGPLHVDVGSGSIAVSRHDGELWIDTGSGDVDLHAIECRKLLVDTGSGAVTANDLACERITIDTGSGAVFLTEVDAAQLAVDTGSGAVDAELIASKTDVLIDTGSGGVNLTVPRDFGAELEVSTGSGGISTDVEMTLRRREDDSLVGRIGAGGPRVVIDTGSGGVRLLRAR